MFNLSEQAKALIEKEIVDINVRIKCLKHRYDWHDQKIQDLKTELSTERNKQKQSDLQKQIDKLIEIRHKIAEEIDEEQLLQTFYMQEIGWSPEPKQ